MTPVATWKSSHITDIGDTVRIAEHRCAVSAPIFPNENGAITGTKEPLWPGLGETVIDGTVVWRVIVL